MKLSFSLIVCLTLIFIHSCQEEESRPQNNTGFLMINFDLQLQVNESDALLKAAPTVDEFVVNIYRSDGTLAMAFDSVAAMPDLIELETGDYYVEAYSANDLPAAFLNPCYYGVSSLFTVESNVRSNVQVICSLSNTIVSVSYTQNLQDNFTDYVTTVSSDEGSLVYGKDEIRYGYFHPLPLEVLVELTYVKPDGSEDFKTLTGSIPDPLPNRHYQIRVDASIAQGMASFLVLMDSSEVLVEVVDINEGSSEPQPGALAYGDLLITEIMYDPSILSDTDGEWFEIYNNSGEPVDLQNLILDRDGTNIHTIDESVVIPAGGYAVASRTIGATDASLVYSYGSAITLSNTGAVLSIFNEDTGTGAGSLIFAVDYGATGFPGGSGTSICLDPSRLNAVDAILGSSWCTSTSVYSTGDAGTPGLVNDSCQ